MNKQNVITIAEKDLFNKKILPLFIITNCLFASSL
jgi:hypothetical protein